MISTIWEKIGGYQPTHWEELFSSVYNEILAVQDIRKIQRDEWNIYAHVPHTACDTSQASKLVKRDVR